MALDDQLLAELYALGDYLPTVSLGVDAADLAVLAYCVHHVRDAIEATGAGATAVMATSAIETMADVLVGVIAELVATGRRIAAGEN